jgi:hypothetical protein
MQGSSHRYLPSKDRRIGNVGLREVGRWFICRRIQGLLENLSHSASVCATALRILSRRVRPAVLARMRSTREYGERLLETEARIEIWGGAGANEGASGLVRCESYQGPRFAALAGYPAVVQEPAARPSFFSDALKGMLCERMACPKGGQRAVLPPFKEPKRGRHQRAGNNTTHFIMQT